MQQKSAKFQNFNVSNVTIVLFCVTFLQFVTFDKIRDTNYKVFKLKL